MSRIELSDIDAHDLIKSLEAYIGDEPHDDPDKGRCETLLDRLSTFLTATRIDRRSGGRDQSRFSERARSLRLSAAKITHLIVMPDRVTKKDFEETKKLMDQAADDLDALLEAHLPGCICRRIEHDNYSYLDYAEACQHHGEFCRRVEAIKADYEKHERALKDEVRLRFVTAALSGTAAEATSKSMVVERAFEIADEALQYSLGTSINVSKKTEAP